MYFRNNFDARSVSATDQQPDQSSFPDELNDAAIRIVKVGDAVDQEAFIWLPLSFPNSQLCNCSESYVANISPSVQPYDVLIVVGSDAKRLTKLLRYYLPTLGRIPKIAVLDRSTPRERSKLLNAGFDDVVTTGMQIPEVRARINAIWQRYLKRRVLKDPSGRGSTCIEPLLFLARERLSKRESDIFRSLFERSPSPVPPEELQAGLAFAQPLKSTSLRVLISTLRKKLKDGVYIQKMTTGYALIVSQGAK